MPDFVSTVNRAILKARKDGRLRYVFATATGYNTRLKKPSGNHDFLCVGAREYAEVHYDFQLHKYVWCKAVAYRTQPEKITPATLF